MKIRESVGAVPGWRRGIFGAMGALAACWSAAGPASAQLVVGCTNGSLPMLVYRTDTGQYAPSIDVGNLAVRGLAADDATRTLWVSVGSQLYRVPYDPPRQPVLVASFSGDTTAISGGLAFDSTRGVLLGTSVLQGTSGSQSNSFYEIDRTTGVTRLVLAVGAGDFGGIDYDATSDVLYAANDSTSTASGLSGRGLYRITLPLTASSFTRIAPYPIKSGTTSEIDIDGLGAGGGKVYLCADETNWMYIFDLAEGVYEPPVPQTAFGLDRASCGATYAPSLLLSPRPDAAAVARAPLDCTVRVGEASVFDCAARNAGTAALSGVVLRATLPTGAAFASSDPEGSLSAGVLTVPLGAVGPGVSVPVVVRLTPAAAGEMSLTVRVSSDQADADASNDSATASTRVLPARATAAALGALASTVTSSASSAVPGVVGVRYLNAGSDSFGPPGVSADGRRFIFAARADSGAPGTGGLVVTVVDGTATLAARTGLYPTVPGSVGAPTAFRSRLSINSDGVWAMAGEDAAGAFLARVSEGSVQAVARSGWASPAYPGDVFYGSTLTLGGIAEDGGLTFGASLAGPGVGSGTGRAVFGADGWTSLARMGLDIPYGQRDAVGAETFFFVGTLDIEAIDAGLAAGGSSGRFVIGGTLNGPAASDRVLIREHPFGGPAVAVQESRPLPGWGLNAAPGEPFAFAASTPGGMVVIGTTAGGADFVLRDAAVLAETGGTAAGGAERWGGNGFLGAAANSAGDSVVVGWIDTGDPLRDSVAVLNGATELVRENDPVDMDNNGVFDDGAYVAQFVPFRCALGSDRFVAFVRLRSERAAAGCWTDETIGFALVTAAFSPTTGYCPADFNQDGGVDGADVEAFFVAWEAADGAADVNQDGGIDGGDVESFFTVWEAGGCP